MPLTGAGKHLGLRNPRSQLAGGKSVSSLCQRAAGNAERILNDYFLATYSAPYGRIRDPSTLVASYNNEAGVSTDYAISTLGGTVTEVTTRWFEGTQSLRINRTGTTRIDATANSSWGTNRRFSGYFWIWAVALPSAEIAVFQITYSSGSNIEFRLNNTGQFKVAQQGGSSSAASATVITTGAWFRVSFWCDTGGAATSCLVAVENDAPVSASWTQAAEQPAEWVFGSRLVTTASTYDLYFDKGRAFTNWFVPAVQFYTLPTQVRAVRQAVGRAGTF